MKSQIAKIALAPAIIASLGASGVFAQQPAGKKNFDREIKTAVESAKPAVGFEHLGRGLGPGCIRSSNISSDAKLRAGGTAEARTARGGIRHAVEANTGSD